MKVLTLFLKHVEYTDEIIQQLAESGVRGGTVIDGSGMASALTNIEDLPIFGLLRHIAENADKEPIKVMMFVLEDEQVKETQRIIKKIIGDIDKPNTGIMFAIPVTDVEGFGE